ncbi:hypothetical protein QTH87_15135 [Variovorax sp. J22P168]|uniref:hypothetical protein n=1 Tax=Variovorax jilinensis TaxID=3053513 RepID=UPI002577AB5F|nr:hypothetical protein [Variovorax sp. J22P168]MDM0013771.1 hypothetical protein [Variovorax sp. J22P168]
MILVKTEAGQRVLKDRSISLTPRQRTAFILFDGKRSLAEVLAAGMGVTREEIDQLLSHGLLAQVGGGAAPAAAEVAVPATAAPSPVAAASGGAHALVEPSSDAAAAVSTVAAPAAGRSLQQRYKDAYPIATQLTGSLGLRGFRLNLSVEGTTNYEQLLELFPKIQAAVGADKAATLEKALRGG